MTRKDICPNCNDKMQRRGFIKRLLRIEYGKKIFIKVPRYYCKNCNKWHRFIPDFVEPYKHYRKDILDNFRKNKFYEENIEFEDYPRDITKYRWNKNK